MARMTRTTLLPMPPGQVFDFLCDPDNALQVMRGVTSFEHLGEGPIGLGARLRQTRVVNGVSATAEVEVTAWDRPERLELTGGAKGVHVRFEYRLAPAPGGTRVSLECEVSGRGVLKMFTPVIMQFVEREEGDHLDRLAAALEPAAGPTARAS